VKMADVGNIVLMGTGFKPEEEIMLFFVTPDGQQADLGYALKPVPKPDKTGTWSASWNAKDYVQTKLVTGGAYRISVTDADLRVLAQTAIFFQLDGDQKQGRRRSLQNENVFRYRATTRPGYR